MAVVALDTVASKDTYLQNGYFVPNAVPAGHFGKGRFPRFGEKAASPVYAPGALVHQPFGSLVPVTVATASASVLSKGHATSAAAFYTQDTLGFFRDAVSKVTVADAGLGAAATTFLDAFEAGTYTTYGPTGGAAVVPGNHIYDAVTIAAGHTDLTASASAIGGAGVTALFSNGNVAVTNVVASDVTTDYVIIFCVGNISFSAAAWITAGKLRKILLVATGTITVLGVHAAPHYSYSAVSVSVAGVVTSVAGGSNYVGLNAAVATQYLYDPNTLSVTIPGVVLHAAGSYADLHTFDLVKNNAALAVAFGGTSAFYNMTATDVSTVWLTAATNMLYRLCCQHQVVPQTVLPADSVVLQAGCYYLLTTFFATNYTTALSFAKTATHVPNFGASTEYSNFSAYFRPDATLATAVWAQTYRVADLVYAPLSAGRYLSCNALGMTSPSTVDFALPTLPYFIETTEITANCPLSLSSTFPANDTILATDGGMDTYTVHNNATANVTAISAYRALKAPVATTLTAPTAVTINVPNKSWVDYSPFNGEVLSADAGLEVIDGRVRLLNGVRQAGVMTANLVCTPSAVALEVFNPFFNGAATVPSTVEFVTFKSLAKVRFNLILSGVSENYTLDAGNSVLIGANNYTYTVAGAVGTLKKVSGGVSTTVGAWTFGAVPAVVNVFLTIVFGDTVMKATTFTTNTVLDNSVPATYFTRNLATADAVYTQVSQPAGTLLYLPGISDPTALGLVEWGVEPVTNMPDFWQASVFHNEARAFPEVVVNGRRESAYVEGQTKVAISLADGTYVNDAAVSVVVADGLANVADLPLTKGFITYVAVKVPNNSGMQVYTIGIDFATFDLAADALKLNTLQRGKHSGVVVDTKSVDLKKKDVITGCGFVNYDDNEGGTIRIVFPCKGVF